MKIPFRKAVSRQGVKISVLGVILFFISANLYSQQLLFHKNRYREALYQTGDIISFRIKKSKARVSEKIIGFEDSLIVFKGFKVNPQIISHVYVDGKTKIWYILRFKYARLLLIGGIGYLLIDTLNHGDINEETLVISGSLVAAGFLAKMLISDRIKIKGRRKLVIIRSMPSNLSH